MTNQMCRGGRSATTMNNMLMIKGQVLTCLLFIVMKLWCSSWTTGPWSSISFFHSRLPFCSFQLNLSVILDVFLLILQTIDSLGCCEYKGGFWSHLWVFNGICRRFYGKESNVHNKQLSWKVGSWNYHNRVSSLNREIIMADTVYR